jgi:hypothetical protein
VSSTAQRSCRSSLMTADTGTKLLPDLLHSTFMVSNTLIYIVLRPMLRFLTGVRVVCCAFAIGKASLCRC